MPLEPRLYGILLLFSPFHRKCLSMNNLQLFPRFSDQGQSSLIKPNQAISCLDAKQSQPPAWSKIATSSPSRRLSEIMTP
jgi:hypothetical protein